MHRMNHEDEEVELPALPPLTPVLGACGRYLQEVTLECMVAVAHECAPQGPPALTRDQPRVVTCIFLLCLCVDYL
jgi:hypothetical protein